MPRATRQGEVRQALIDAAGHLVATEGTAGLTIRRVADEAKTSTMAIYTHFGGVAGLRYAVRRQGFAQFGMRLGEVDDTSDPVEDLSALGLVYVRYAVDETDLYRVMFLEPVLDEIDADIGWDTFDVLIRGVQRCIDAHRFDGGDPEQIATQLWAVAHGTVSLHLAGLLSVADAVTALGAAALHLYTGYGDTAEQASGALQHALDRVPFTADQDPRTARDTTARKHRMTPTR